MKIVRILAEASDILHRSGIPEPRREAASLLQFALRKDRTFLIAHPEYEPSNDDEERFRSFVKRRANREPYHHITGVKEFYGLDFEVSPDVLIPRPETEMLVENSIAILQKIDRPAFCEVGVGSGCISIAILRSVKSATAAGLEIAENAMKIAKRNVEKHGVVERFNLSQSDIFSALRNETFDLIVSNPPYISARDLLELQREVRDFEPHIALTDGGDGLSIIESIARQSPKHLNPGGFLLMEIGIHQDAAVRAMFDTQRWESVEILSDFQAIRRMVRACVVSQ